MKTKAYTEQQDKEWRHIDSMCVNESEKEEKGITPFKYILAGVVFGIVLTKTQAISWFRIQEMFHFMSFHMYGVIGTAVAVGALSVFLIRTFKLKTLQGEDIIIADKKFNKGLIYGGLIFGFGWAITGACPGPMFALIGAGSSVTIITLLSAIAGTWVYGKYRDKLPH